MKLNRVKTSSFLLLAVFLLLLLTSVVQTPVISALKTAVNDESLAYYIYMIIAQTVVFILPAIFYAAFTKKPFSSMRIKGFKPRHLPFIFFLTITTSIMVIILNWGAAQIFNKTGETVLNSFSMDTSEQIVFAVIALVLLPAISEEILLRSIVLSDFEAVGTRYAIIVSAIAFSCIHSSFYNFFGPLLAGIIYGYLTYRLNSVIPSILAHIINNLFALGMSIYIKHANIQIDPILFLFVCLVVFLVILLITVKLFAILLSEKESKDRYIKPKPVYYMFKSTFNLCFVIFLFIWIIRSVLELTGKMSF